jgi:son of sevenless
MFGANSSSSATVTMNQVAIDRRPNASFCRALYDYTATDTSSLSFHKNDILEVVNRLESGWWDGYLGELRGWFPSNYVAVISMEEAEEVFYNAQVLLPPSVQAASYGKDKAMNGIAEEESSSEDNWLQGEEDHSISGNGNGNGGHERSNSFESTEETNDFWLPEVTADGQVTNCYYYSFPFPNVLTPHSDILCK